MFLIPVIVCGRNSVHIVISNYPVKAMLAPSKPSASIVYSVSSPRYLPRCNSDGMRCIDEIVLVPSMRMRAGKMP